jgi:hypothetical protein
MSADPLATATKDELILAMLAVLGGEQRSVNERDLFLAAWHAFPSTMRWTDTALPNPDTFTASLRRLDQRGVIERAGKQERKKRGKSSRSRAAFEPGRSGVVKTRIVEGGMSRAGVSADLVEEVRRLRPDRESSRSLSPGALIALCVGLREAENRHLDEGSVAELAFHKFPDRFSFDQRPEFPDLERIRQAVRSAIDDGLIDADYTLSPKGNALVAGWQTKGRLRLDVSGAHKTGDLRFADRIEQSPAYQAWSEHGTLTATKPDELFRALRIPPTSDPKPVADALVSRVKAARRIDKGDLAAYLLEVARRHNSDVMALFEDMETHEPEDPTSLGAVGQGKE